jgi:hypothetical protein
MKVETPTYRLELSEDGLWATLRSPAGETWAPLRPLAALDTVAGVDETLAVSPPKALAGPVPTFEFERRSTVWERAGTTVVCREDAVEIRPWVRGRGELTDVHLLGGRSVIPGRPTGFLSSGSRFRTLFSPNPEEPDRPLRPATEPAAIGVSGDSEPGRRRWFFTPAPLVFALSVDEREWLGLELAAPVEELNFVELTYRPAGDAFSLLLDYDGHTHVDGRFEAPAVRITPGLADPYAALRGRREQGRRERAGWWSKPIFCGWGAQSHLAGFDGNPAADFATQEHYDRFLDHLERRGLVPGTVVVDDKWQEAYGTCVPDRAKWPDLKGWISERHARGQHVLLWWKAWDPEALPPGLCIRNPDGAAVAFDPGNPLARETLCEIVESMLGADGLDADGLKVDFTARTPSGRSLSGRGRAWGIALLHELLATVYRAAKEAKQDALVITHTPHPSFVDVTDMIRLNDMVGAAGGSELTAQMRHRAEVVRAACPELLVDTDDWRVPDLESWRHYLQVKPELGVPSLYYATHLDATGEALTDGDYAALRDVWERARA